MREALFRAAQKTGSFPSEETVGQYQNRALTQRCFDTSLLALNTQLSGAATGPKLVIWPYPSSTADCIDRANCADDFLRQNPSFRVMTELGLNELKTDGLEGGHDDLVVFAPFEALSPSLSIDSGGQIWFKGRRPDAIMSEMTIGYVGRRREWSRGLRSMYRASAEHRAMFVETNVVNGSTHSLFKGMQMEHFARYCANKEGLSALPVLVAWDEAQMIEEIVMILQNERGAVVRPFSASQGTGVTFIDQRLQLRRSRSEIVEEVLHQMKVALHAKYGSGDPFPVAVCPFVESVQIEGCLSDLRIFVVYDPEHGGLRGLPGMIRRAQVPFQRRDLLTSDACMTNLNAPMAEGALNGQRIFPLTSANMLARLKMVEDDLVALCGHAAAMWLSAFHDERLFFARQHNRQFGYGSVDFCIRAADGLAVPIEMNGLNVGSHATVHPNYCEAFGRATTATLVNLGLGEVSR